MTAIRLTVAIASISSRVVFVNAPPNSETRVVDEHVERADRILGLPDEALSLGGVGEVRRDHMRLDAHPAKFLDARLELDPGQVRDGEVGALTAYRARDVAAEASARSGDQHPRSPQLHHAGGELICACYWSASASCRRRPRGAIVATSASAPSTPEPDSTTGATALTQSPEPVHHPHALGRAAHLRDVLPDVRWTIPFWDMNSRSWCSRTISAPASRALLGRQLDRQHALGAPLDRVLGDLGALAVPVLGDDEQLAVRARHVEREDAVALVGHVHPLDPGRVAAHRPRTSLLNRDVWPDLETSNRSSAPDVRRTWTSSSPLRILIAMIPSARIGVL